MWTFDSVDNMRQCVMWGKLMLPHIYDCESSDVESHTVWEMTAKTPVWQVGGCSIVFDAVVDRQLY